MSDKEEDMEYRFLIVGMTGLLMDLSLSRRGKIEEEKRKREKKELDIEGTIGMFSLMKEREKNCFWSSKNSRNSTQVGNTLLHKGEQM